MERTYTSEGTVIVPIEKYDELISIATDSETFIDMALRTARLDYTLEDLSLDSEYIKAFIKSIDEEEYVKRITELRNERAREIRRHEKCSVALDEGQEVTKEVAEDE